MQIISPLPLYRVTNAKDKPTEASLTMAIQGGRLWRPLTLFAYRIYAINLIFLLLRYSSFYLFYSGFYIV